MLIPLAQSLFQLCGILRPFWPWVIVSWCFIAKSLRFQGGWCFWNAHTFDCMHSQHVRLNLSRVLYISLSPLLCPLQFYNSPHLSVCLIDTVLLKMWLLFKAFQAQPLHAAKLDLSLRSILSLIYRFHLFPFSSPFAACHIQTTCCLYIVQ